MNFGVFKWQNFSSSASFVILSLLKTENVYLTPRRVGISLAAAPVTHENYYSLQLSGITRPAKHTKQLLSCQTSPFCYTVQPKPLVSMGMLSAWLDCLCLRPGISSHGLLQSPPCGLPAALCLRTKLERGLCL